MADSTSHLALLSASQAGKELTANALFNAASPAMIFAYDRSNSSGLYWGYFGGRYRKPDGSRIWIPNGQVILTGSYGGTQNYIEVSQTGTVSVNTSGWTNGSKPLYTVWTTLTGPYSWVDYRTGREGEAKIWDRYVATISYASTINIDLGLGIDVGRITLGGSPSIYLHGGGDGQIITLELTQDAIGSRVVTWGAECHFAQGLPSPTLTGEPGRMDRIAFQCMGAGSPSRYDCVAFVAGY